MYTHCPECQIAFRVTANVLQRASGRVRCGGCGHAFSALDHLSEEQPDQSVTGPQLTADSGDRRKQPDLDEQSKALLQTLDSLAGPADVRIEDTGVEWRVIDEDEIPEEEVPEVTDQIDSDALAGSQHYLALSAMVARSEERRYDDNTPLPEDFSDDDEMPYTPPAEKPRRRASDYIQPVPSEVLDLQGDLALSEPEEWTDILDEVGAEALLEAEADSDSDSETETETDDDTGPDEPDIVDEPPQVGGTAGPLADVEEVESGLRESTDVFNEQILAAQDALERGETEEWQEEAQEDIQADEDAVEDEPEVLSVDMFDLKSEDRPAPLDARLDPEVATTDEEHDVPDPTTEELSINEEIDQQLALASTQDKLLVQTIAGDSFNLDDSSLNVETIVMEGDFVGEAFELGPPQNDDDALVNPEDRKDFADTYMMNQEAGRAGRRKTDPAGAGVYVAVVLLAIALIGQVVHASREMLATHGMFNQSIGPVYRALGSPVTPDWDIKGWQFEATSGGTDDDGKVLTILTRIVNKSQQNLPYPLVHVSLTDRWEEIIGSRVLEPNEYLAGGLDTSRQLAPGERFTAAISIDDPSEDATGYKLNLCYRLAPGQLRCAIEDFKD